MSIELNATAVHIENIGIALSGQVFEGFASDNILHFNLNTIYVQFSEERTVSRLIGTSLALYMIGISVSPAIASTLPNFQASFTMASAIFAIAILYLYLGVRTKHPERLAQRQFATTQKSSKIETPMMAGKASLWSLWKVSTSPLRFFVTRPLSLILGVSLLLYNATQSYLFPAMMVHTTVNFGFTSRENGYLISIAHGVSSTYLLSTLFIVPYIWQKLRTHKRVEIPGPMLQKKSGFPDAALAMFSLLMQVLSVTLFGLASEPWQIYCAVALCALGLATPSFVKSYFVTLFPSDDAPQAVAALAMMETLGSLLAPLGLGGLQTLWPGSGVFFAAAACIGVSSMLFAAGAVLFRIKQGLYRECNDTGNLT